MDVSFTGGISNSGLNPHYKSEQINKNTFIAIRDPNTNASKFVKISQVLKIKDRQKLETIYKSFVDSIHRYEQISNSNINISKIKQVENTILKRINNLKNNKFYKLIFTIKSIINRLILNSKKNGYSRITTSQEIDLNKYHKNFLNHIEKINEGLKPKIDRKNSKQNEIDEIQKLRKEDISEELKRLNEIPRIKESIQVVNASFEERDKKGLSPKEQVVFGHTLELREKLKDDYYVLNHGQNAFAMTMNMLSRILKNTFEPELHRGAVLRHDVFLKDLQEDVNTVQYYTNALKKKEGVMQEDQINDHSFRKGLLCADCYLENTSHLESSLDFFSGAYNVGFVLEQGFIYKIVSDILLDYFPGNQVDEIAREVLALTNKVAEQGGGTLYSICIPKEKAKEMSYISEHFGHPYDESKFNFDDLDAIQEGKDPLKMKGLSKDENHIPQIRLLTHKLKPENGVFIVENSTIDNSKVEGIRKSIESIIEKSRFLPPA